MSDAPHEAAALPTPPMREQWGLEGPAIGIAVSGPSSPAQWQRTLATVDRAEALGLHSVWMPEMHFSPGATPAPLIDLAALATRTKRLRLATTSLLLPVHPARELARAAAMLDQLSDGRLILGLGRGFRAPLFRAFGVAASTKRDRFDQALDEMRACWRDPDAVAPRQQPSPPLAVAAFGPKGLAQAARHGLPYLASPMEPLDQLLDNHALYREQLALQRDPAEVVVAIMRTVHVAATDAEARSVREALARESRASVPRGKLPAALERAASAAPEERHIVGTLDFVSDRLAQHREALGLDLLVVRSQVPATESTAQQRSLESLAGLAESWAP